MAEDGPLLVVLADTGERRDDLPVLVLHNSPQPALRVLTRGLSGHLLRVYGWGRTYLDDEAKRESGYVDLHRDMAVSGSFGALDQIFPHELAHLLVAQFSGPRRPGGSTQVHGVGVRTDPETAFDEGFAEHFQVMAVDDPAPSRILPYSPTMSTSTGEPKSKSANTPANCWMVRHRPWGFRLVSRGGSEGPKSY